MTKNKRKRTNEEIDFKQLYEREKAEKEIALAEKEREKVEKEREKAEKEREKAEKEIALAEKEIAVVEMERERAEKEALKNVLEIEKDERITFFGTRMLPSSGGHSKASKKLKGYYKKTCLFCGNTEPDVTSAHIVAGNKQKSYSQFGRPKYKSNLQIKSARNFIPLCGTLGMEGTCHDNFDRYLMTLIYNPLQQEYTVYCLGSQHQLHGKKVELHPDHKPYTRLLSWRLKACIRQHPELVKDDIRDMYILGNMSEDSKSISNLSFNSEDSVNVSLNL